MVCVPLWHVIQSQLRILHIPPIICVLVCVSPTVASERLGEDVTRRQIDMQQWKNSGHIVFSVVHVVPKADSRLVLPRTSCMQYFLRTVLT
jgi:hypothetical protein